jgi:hypothetical protein
MKIYSRSRFAEVVHEKVETSCGAATSFSCTASGTRRAKIAEWLFFGSFFGHAKKEHNPV